MPDLIQQVYLVQFRRNGAAMTLRAMTAQDPHLNFRNQAEAIIKSFDLGPSDASVQASSPPTTGSTPSPPR